MKKLLIYDGDNREKPNDAEDLGDASFLENFKGQSKSVLFIAATVVTGVALLVGIAYKRESASKNVPENESTKHARKAVELLRQITHDIDPDQDNIANTLQAVCSSAKEEFDRIKTNELDSTIWSALGSSITACLSATVDARDPLVVPEDIEDILRTLKYRKIRDKSFQDNISKVIGKREEAAKKLRM